MRIGFLGVREVGWKWGAVIVGALAIGGAPAGPVRADPAAPVRMVLASTPKHTDEMREVDGGLTADRPGHQIELMREAAAQCGVAVEFRFVPWRRALLMVRNGDADGAFTSSYDPERATYGAYPMKDGKPDVSRALKDYRYSFYVSRDSSVQWDGKRLGVGGGTVVAERGASVIPQITALGLSPVEIADNATMLRMVAGKRVTAAALMTSAADAVLAEDAELALRVMRLEPPIESKFGFVMLSKAFHANHRDVAECFWNTIRDIRA
ncbi:MAG: transporter substrate-binding domain-containing protein, partial [Pseudomonadota bacterium]